MYLVQMGRDYTLEAETLVKAMILAVSGFKDGWETDVVNRKTGEVMVSLRDHEAPYFSTAIQEVQRYK